VKYVFPLLFFVISLHAQGVDHIRENMAAQDANFQPYKYNAFQYICPWQSVRLQSHAHFQIEIRGSKTEIMAIDAALVQRDLDEIWGQWNYTSLHLLDRGYNIDVHTSIPYRPIFRWFDKEWDQVANAYDPDNCPSPCNGWYMHALPNGLIYAIREFSPDDYQISFVRFVKWRNGPKWDTRPHDEMTQELLKNYELRILNPERTTQ